MNAIKNFALMCREPDFWGTIPVMAVVIWVLAGMPL